MNTILKQKNKNKKDIAKEKNLTQQNVIEPNFLFSFFILGKETDLKIFWTKMTFFKLSLIYNT